MQDIILHRKEPLPVSAMQPYTTSRDFDTKLVFKVFAGIEGGNLKWTLIGTFSVDNLPSRKKGEIMIKVTFSLSEGDGRLIASWVDATQGIDSKSTSAFSTCKSLPPNAATFKVSHV